jgi:hypothetical protein
VLVAIREVFDKDSKILLVMISAAGRDGETMIFAQANEAFWNAVAHVKPLSVGSTALWVPRAGCVDVHGEAMVNFRSDCSHARRFRWARLCESRRNDIRWSPI